MRIEIVQKRGWLRTRYFWRIVGANGETLAHSENYASHQKAEQTVDEVVKAGRLGLAVIPVTE